MTSNRPVSEMVELKPCPFCGSAAKLVDSARFRRWGLKRWWVICTKSGVCIANRPDPANYSCELVEDAVRLWNTRASSQAPSDSVERGRALSQAVSNVLDVLIDRELIEDSPPDGNALLSEQIFDALEAAAIPSAVASDDVRDALVKAYTAGATEVHDCWMAGKAIECMSPDFTEAAHDYASEAVAAIPSDGGVEPQDLGASSGFDPARMTMFLEILSAAGGEADASESSWNWINAFLEEHEKRYPDTFNEAIDAGYVDWSHDSDSDNSTIRLTATGRAALKASGEE